MTIYGDDCFRHFQYYPLDPHKLQIFVPSYVDRRPIPSFNVHTRLMSCSLAARSTQLQLNHTMYIFVALNLTKFHCHGFFISISLDSAGSGHSRYHEAVRKESEYETNIPSLVGQIANLPSSLASLVLAIRIENAKKKLTVTNGKDLCAIHHSRIISVALSMDAVASSSTNTLLLLSKARPRQNSCRCPMLQFDPSSTTVDVQYYQKQDPLQSYYSNKSQIKDQGFFPESPKIIKNKNT
ncbi:hypothetical protein Cgig2_005073 [Carnegiea gigantea]|uniref:Uncharacterized protein n=1 Tax=Carnegiea gigantea TaxID=171969 RepID=A0A9Q1KZN0_9CARY|nr:hypothetical protein Cgig2_005073 [Carnegiea gigantea]